MDALHGGHRTNSRHCNGANLMEKHDMAFWLAAMGATLVKLITAPYTGLWRAVVTVFAAVFSAFFLTSPMMDLLGLAPEIYTTAMAALMALTGEGLMRWLIGAANEPTKIIDLLKQWRGGK